MSDDTSKIIEESERSGLTVSIFSVSLDMKLTYFFMTAAARDQAVERWRSKNIEIINEEVKPMTKDEGIKAAIDYLRVRQQLLGAEDTFLENTHDVMPAHAVQRQREILLESNKIGAICKALES